MSTLMDIDAYTLEVGDLVYHENIRVLTKVRKIEECYHYESPAMPDGPWIYPEEEIFEDMMRSLEREGFFSLICDIYDKFTGGPEARLRERLNLGPYTKYYHIYYDSDEIPEERIRFDSVLTIRENIDDIPVV